MISSINYDFKIHNASRDDQKLDTIHMNHFIFCAKARCDHSNAHGQKCTFFDRRKYNLIKLTYCITNDEIENCEP
jgi:hypothetical protein